VLHRHTIAEMKTGEGKTLVGTLPVYLNALEGKGVHVVTVNDYLASRDKDWMSRVYEFLGLKVGCILHHMSDEERKETYAGDITYATNSELGFDYLRDNMKTSRNEMVLRPFNYAIVDEVDSILIDEARTPLIISGPSEESSGLYTAVDALVPSLEDEDFEKDEKNRSVHLSESGMVRMEKLVREKGLLRGQHLYEDQNITLVHHINQALKAHKSFARDVDYIVKDGKVMLVDEFTGRIMDGRRYSDGLHQALEAKEHVNIEIENQTLASITYQNFFRLYPKLAGMTGTALTDAEEFHAIYKLSVISIPTHKPVQRKDQDDEVYRTFKEKMEAVLDLVKKVNSRGQPILLGTVSIEKSEVFSALLQQDGIMHQVLNARQHAREAQIIAEAGSFGAITIATNMAGRGTDIKLGGNLEVRLEEALKGVEDDTKREKITEKVTDTFEKERQKVLDAGGLFILGTERHESRRIDNQLRGRSGRQGDPGASKFFLSLEDDLMRIFGSERLDDWLVKLGLKEGEAITHPWINKALEKAQRRVEARNFDVRKHLLKYDDIMSQQRKVVYAWRDQLMDDPQSVSEVLTDECKKLTNDLLDAHVPRDAYQEMWTLDKLQTELTDLTSCALKLPSVELSREVVEETLNATLTKALKKKASDHGKEVWTQLASQTLLKQLDQGWKDHLYALDHLRQGVHLRSYAQKDPLSEYASEAFRLFQAFFAGAMRQALGELLKMAPMKDIEARLKELAERMDLDDENLIGAEAAPSLLEQGSANKGKRSGHTPKSGARGGETERRAASFGSPGMPEGAMPPSRNAPCPCGSGKRYKNCHGQLS
jgi:preprotein translocase subunit SecA